MVEVTSDSWCSSSIFRAYKKENSPSATVWDIFLSVELFLSFSVPVLRAHGGLEEQASETTSASVSPARVCRAIRFLGERLTRLLVDPHHLLRLPLLPGGESRDSTASVWMITSTNTMSTSVNSEYAIGASLLLILSMLISIVYMMFMPGSHTMHISIVTNLLVFLLD